MRTPTTSAERRQQDPGRGRAAPMAFILRARGAVIRGPLAHYADWIMPVVFGVTGLLLFAVLTRGLYLSQIWAAGMAQ